MKHEKIEVLINNEAESQLEDSKAPSEVRGAFRAGFYNGGMFSFRTLSAEHDQEIARLREALVFIHDECLKRPVDVRAIIKAIKEAEQ